ncbi:hypothetical protein LTR66_003604 [Elasticomyces elasticus]|nr:hypothetical protein LTR66_003604 [Elasticomyces elasticus]
MLKPSARTVTHPGPNKSPKDHSPSSPHFPYPSLLPSPPSSTSKTSSHPRLSSESITPSRPSLDASTLPTLVSLDEVPEALSPHDEELAHLRQAHQSIRLPRTHRRATSQALLPVTTSCPTALSTAAEPPTGVLDRKLAGKDAQIAQLLDEGQALSKRELTQLNTIKKLRVSRVEEKKANVVLKIKLEKAENERDEVGGRVRRVEMAGRAAGERIKVLRRIEHKVEVLRGEREDAGRTIDELRRRAENMVARAYGVEKRVKMDKLEAETRAARDLREEIETLRIEKEVVEDRARAELRDARDEANRQAEKARICVECACSFV